MQDHIINQTCVGCSVRPACLEYAIATRQESGIWGGVNEFTLRKLVKKAYKAELNAAH